MWGTTRYQRIDRQSALIPMVGQFLLLALCLASTAGCTSLNLGKTMPWPLGEEKPGKPEKVVAIWTDAVHHQPNQPPVRGFGGRLMFFEAKKDKPIKMEGTLVVYAFDETNRDPSNAKPDRKYVFPPDQLPAHYSLAKLGTSELGHSYSVWLPWDAVGGAPKEISLVVRFEPKGGAASVAGELSRQLLPGQTTPARTDPRLAAAGAMTRTPPVAPQDQAVQPTSYNAAAPRRMTATTIPIPSEMACGPLCGAGVSPAPAARMAAPQNAAYSQSPSPSPMGMGGPSPEFAPATEAAAMARLGPRASSLSLRSRFSPSRFRAPGERFAPPSRERAPWSQPLAGSPSVPALPPGSESGSGWPESPPAAGSATR